jgi:hypothetical protein
MAAKFVNATDKIIIPDISLLEPTAATTWEAWFYYNVSTYQNINTGAVYGQDDERSIYVDNVNKIHARVDTTSGLVGINDPNTIPLQSWHHWAVTFDGSVGGGTVTLYKDGVQVAQSTGIGTALKSPTFTGHWIGFWSTLNDSAHGYISDFRIWNVARSASQIAGYYNKRLNGNESGLVGYWKLNETSGTTAYDSTSNGNNGTLSGAVFSSDVGEPPFVNSVFLHNFI